jgi:alkylation response protein AidB-like acyl-CoA dehydrogenase
MWTYEAPLRDMQFVMEDVLGAPQSWGAIPALADLDAETARQILEEAGKFTSGVLAPTNGPGDLEGCHWQNGAVTTPKGYPEAYRAFVEGGWPALACDPGYGGQGLPQLLNVALYEMLAAGNHGWTMYPGLLHGAYECLKAHGSDALREQYLPKIVSGEWLSTMCLTEPQAGSDLSLLRTRAEPQADGSIAVTGTKIFISGGDHDLTDNIVHLVLCRLNDPVKGPAPAGTKGLSIVLCPKILPDGSLNKIRCDGIEKKMGLKGSATCVMSFEGATGWLVGEAHRGLAAMFVMMNAARLSVGMQGLGHLEMANQNAHRYAQERLQMRVAQRPAGSPKTDSADPIALHPAMRRTLWSLRAMTEGQRVIAYWTAQLLDQAEQHPDAAQRKTSAELVALLTPVVKAFLTHNGFNGAAEALQVWGGYGYIHEYGIEQTVRDSRVAMLYEGTNEIQAVDLVQRKLLDDGGARLGLLLQEFETEIQHCQAAANLAGFAAALQTQTVDLKTLIAALLAGREQDPEWPLRVADDVLHGLGFALLTWAWAKSARAAQLQVDDPWYADKTRVARFGLEWLIPQSAWRLQRALSQAASLPFIRTA